MINTRTILDIPYDKRNKIGEMEFYEIHVVYDVVSTNFPHYAVYWVYSDIPQLKGDSDSLYTAVNLMGALYAKGYGDDIWEKS